MQPRDQKQGQQKNGEQGRQAALATQETPQQQAYGELKKMLVADRMQLEILIPRKVRAEFSPNRLIVVAMNAFIKMGCPTNVDLYSIRDAVIWAAQLGLEAGTDQAYLVPYGPKVQLIIGPRGLIDCAMRHPSVQVVQAGSIMRGDYFDYDLGDSGYIKIRKGDQRPTPQAERAAMVTHSYAYCKTVNGGCARMVLTRADIDFRRSFSKASKGPWFDNFEGMARKSAIKAGAPDWPRDPLLSLALHEDDDGAYAPPATTPKEIIEMIEDAAVPMATEPKRQSADDAPADPAWAANHGAMNEKGKAPTAAPPAYGDPAENFPRE